MERASYVHANHWNLWEEAAARLRGGDRFCSSPYWGLSLATAFHSRSQLFVYSQNDDLAVFQELDVVGGRLLLPCDTMWCLGSPLLARDGSIFLEDLCRYLVSVGDGVQQVTIGGLYQDNPTWGSRVWATCPHWTLPASGRQVASLEGGCDGFLSRRSANFRSRLRRAVKKAENDGLSVEFWPHFADVAATLRLLDRAMKVESESWKGLAGQGVNRGQMNSFYRHMLPMLATHGRLRGLFLTRQGEDLSYLFGASFAGTFRGLQFSYLESESDSLGNVGQWRMIEHLVSEGCLAYDLGQAMSYKERWAESNIASPSRTFQIGLS